MTIPTPDGQADMHGTTASQEPSRPEIPKRLAARLRAVYQRLADARSYLAHAEADFLDAVLHLQIYEDDPDQFAALYYPSVGGGADSYPVRTHIERTRDKVEHRQERMPAYQRAVADAEAAAQATETDVRSKVGAMKPTSPGRVAWPAAPRSLAEYRRNELKGRQRDRKRYRMFVEKRCRDRQAADAQRKEDEVAFWRDLDIQIEATAAQLSPPAAATYRAFFAALRAACQSGQFGGAEVLALAQGDTSPLRAIIDGLPKADGASA